MSTTVRTTRAAPGWAARAGGLLAISISVVLLASVVLRGLEDALNIWTIVLGAIAGVLALQHRPTRLGLFLCVILLIAAALPALIGGVGYLYVPSILLLLFEVLAPAKSSR